MDNVFNVKVISPRSKAKDDQTCYVAQPYIVASDYIHFQKADITKS